jgi:hypothetical protein
MRAGETPNAAQKTNATGFNPRPLMRAGEPG